MTQRNQFASGQLNGRATQKRNSSTSADRLSREADTNRVSPQDLLVGAETREHAGCGEMAILIHQFAKLYGLAWLWLYTSFRGHSGDIGLKFLGYNIAFVRRGDVAMVAHMQLRINTVCTQAHIH
jgi:hypothetical protein